jgi:hypothetical protein
MLFLQAQLFHIDRFHESKREISSEITVKRRQEMAKITKQEARKFLGNVPQQYEFHCHDGRSFRSLNDFQDSLTSMTDDVFAYHSNQTKSDFSNWVRDVIGDEKLASDLLISANRPQAADAVNRRVVFLAGKIS